MSTTQAEQDLAFIREIMSESRSFATRSGIYFIVWGVVIALAMALTWAFSVDMIDLHPFIVWGVAIVVGWAFSIWHGRRMARSSLAFHPSGEHIGWLWFALGITMTVAFFPGQMSGAIEPTAIPGLAALMVGAGVFVTAVLARIGWLRWIAAAWWIAGAVTITWPGSYALLLYAGLMVVLQVVPGIVLERMARRPEGGGSGRSGGAVGAAA